MALKNILSSLLNTKGFEGVFNYSDEIGAGKNILLL